MISKVRVTAGHGGRGGIQVAGVAVASGVNDDRARAAPSLSPADSESAAAAARLTVTMTVTTSDYVTTIQLPVRPFQVQVASANATVTGVARS